MAYARIVFAGGNLGSLELGLDAIDDPAHLDELVKSITVLWRMAEAEESE